MRKANSIIKFNKVESRARRSSQGSSLGIVEFAVVSNYFQLHESFQCKNVRHKRTKWCEAMKSEREFFDKKKSELNGMLLEEYLISFFFFRFYCFVRLYFLIIVSCHHPSARACFSYASHLYAR